MWNLELAKDIYECGLRVFSPEAISYPYHEIISGVYVKKCRKKMKAVASNTLRSWHRKDKKAKGISEPLEKYFRSPIFLQNIKNVKTQEDLHQLSDKAVRKLRYDFNNKLEKPLNDTSYGKIRKLIDLEIEHIVAMSIELTESRERLIPLLFIPLDSQIFKEELIFSQEELDKATILNKMERINRRSTYGSIKTEAAYLFLQEQALKKAQYIQNEYNLPCFHRIYFDLFWGDKNPRYKQKGNNLFELNS